jgi:ribonuclease P protein subunit POP4
MKVTPDVIRWEFIGTQAKVAKSKDAGYVGVSGKVVNETRNTFTIKSEQKRKTIAKEPSVFHFSFQDGTIVEVDGRLLVGKPEDRLKKSIRRLW